MKQPSLQDTTFSTTAPNTSQLPASAAGETSLGSAPRTVQPDEYVTAASLAQYESQLYWTIMGMFLVPESLLLGFLGTALADDILLLASPALAITSIVGTVITLFWSSALLRSARWHDLRVLQARRYEEEHGNSRLFSEGKVLSERSTIQIGSDTVAFPPLARLLTIKRAGHLLVDVFAITFGVASVVALSGLL